MRLTLYIIIIANLMLVKQNKVCGQKEGNIWAFGLNAGLDFNGSTPVVMITQIDQHEGSAAVCDRTTGNLLFYTDGSRIWDASHQLMPNGTIHSTTQTESSKQAALIVPMPDSVHKYYVFTLNASTTGTPNNVHPDEFGKLYYSIVDMNLNGGTGAVIANYKKILIDSGLTECLVAIPGNECNIWIIAHNYNGNTFKAYSIYPTGLEAKPVLSHSGATMGANMIGSLSVSPDNKRISYHRAGGFLFGDTHLELFHFDNVTGKILHSFSITPPNTWGFWGACFSPDNTKLYASTASQSGTAQLYQYDLTSGAINTIQSSATNLGNCGRGDIQRGPDGKIYTLSVNPSQLSQIVFPNLRGNQCNYMRNALTLNTGSITRFGLPNLVPPMVKSDTTLYYSRDTIICRESENTFTTIRLRGPSEYQSYQWQNGKTDESVSVDKPGKYWVTSTKNHGCTKRVDTFFVYAGPDLTFSLGNDTIICSDLTPFILQTGVSDAQEFLWQDNTQLPYFKVVKPGIFWVKITKDGCSAYDTIAVAQLDLDQNLGNDIRFCSDETIAIRLSTHNLPVGAEVRWNTQDSTSYIIANDTGTYTVTVRYLGCEGYGEMSIGHEYCQCKTFVGNAFSPNNDGNNDVFQPIIENNCLVRNYSLNIYNRFGERIFYSANLDRGWDGYYSGKLADVGVYFFELYFIGGTRQQAYYKKGDLTLIR